MTAPAPEVLADDRCPKGIELARWILHAARRCRSRQVQQWAAAGKRVRVFGPAYPHELATEWARSAQVGDLFAVAQGYGQQTVVLRALHARGLDARPASPLPYTLRVVARRATTNT